MARLEQTAPLSNDSMAPHLKNLTGERVEWRNQSPFDRVVIADLGVIRGPTISDFLLFEGCNVHRYQSHTRGRFI